MSIESLKSQLNISYENWTANLKDKNYAELPALFAKISSIAESILSQISKENQVDHQQPFLNLLSLRLSKLKGDLGQLKAINSVSAKALFAPMPNFKELNSIEMQISNLENKISMLEENRMLVDYFEVPSSFKDDLSSAFRSCVDGLFNFIKTRISRHLFMGYKSSYASHLEDKLEKLGKEKSAILEKLATRNKDSLEIIKTLLEIKPEDRDEENKLFLDMVGSNQVKLIEKLIRIEAELSKAQASLDKIKAGAELGKKTRQELHAIGGESVKISTPDNKAILDGMYLSADKFKHVLKEAGGKMYSLSIHGELVQDKQKVKPLEITGIAFNKADFNKSSVKTTLENLGVFPGAGLLQVEYKDHILFMDEKEFAIFNSHHSDSITEKWSEIDLTPKPDRGTAIITSGNAGVYEMHKREVMAFLLKGMNVMAFNFRGYGESSGTPTPIGLKQDMEAVYQYIKQKGKDPLPDDKILLKALCMSGGPATYLASNHPGINLLLDQSYSNFADKVKDQAKIYIKDFVEKHFSNSQSKQKFLSGILQWLTNSIINTLIRLSLIPDWNTQKEIRKVTGHVGLLLTQHDTLMTTAKDGYENYKALLAGKQAGTVSIGIMPGVHGDSWLKSLNIYEEVSLETALAAEYQFTEEHPELDFSEIIETRVADVAKQYANQIPKEEDMSSEEYQNEVDALNKNLTEFWHKIAANIQPPITQKAFIAEAEKYFTSDIRYKHISDEDKTLYLAFIKDIFSKSLSTTALEIQSELKKYPISNEFDAKSIISFFISERYSLEEQPAVRNYIFQLLKLSPEPQLPIQFSSLKRVQNIEIEFNARYPGFSDPSSKLADESMVIDLIKKLKTKHPSIQTPKILLFWNSVKGLLRNKSLSKENIQKTCEEVLSRSTYQTLSQADKEIYINFFKEPNLLQGYTPIQSLQHLKDFLIQNPMDKFAALEHINLHVQNNYPLDRQEQIKEFLLKLINFNELATFIDPPPDYAKQFELQHPEVIKSKWLMKIPPSEIEDHIDQLKAKYPDLDQEQLALFYKRLSINVVHFNKHPLELAKKLLNSPAYDDLSSDMKNIYLQLVIDNNNVEETIITSPMLILNNIKNFLKENQTTFTPAQIRAYIKTKIAQSYPESLTTQLLVQQFIFKFIEFPEERYAGQYNQDRQVGHEYINHFLARSNFAKSL